MIAASSLFSPMRSGCKTSVIFDLNQFRRNWRQGERGWSRKGDILNQDHKGKRRATKVVTPVKVVSLLFNRRAGFFLLAVLLATLVIGQYLTRGGDGGSVPDAGASQLVDQTPLLTARRLAAEAGTAQEQQQASEALRVADHAVDQAFEAAFRAAAADTTPLKGEALEVSQKIAVLEGKIQT